MKLADYWDAKYDKLECNCVHFVIDVWKELTGQNIEPHLCDEKRGIDPSTMPAYRLKAFERTDAKSGPALVLMRACDRSPHVGIWHKGRILHFSSKGLQWCLLEMLKPEFNDVRFYNVKTCHNN